jgi:hypothetical protein
MDIEYLSERVRVWTEQNCGSEYVPPTFSQWLQYWNDDDTVIGNLRNLEHWLERAQVAKKLRS